MEPREGEHGGGTAGRPEFGVGLRAERGLTMSRSEGGWEMPAAGMILCAEMPAEGVLLRRVRGGDEGDRGDKNEVEKEGEEGVNPLEDEPVDEIVSSAEVWRQMAEQDEWRADGRGEGLEDESWLEALEHSDRLGVVWGGEGELGGFDMRLDDEYDESGAPVDHPKEGPLPWDAGFRNSMRATPSDADWARAQRGVPEPEKWDNPAPWRVDDEFVAGCATGLSAAGHRVTVEEWKEVLPEAHRYVTDMIRDGGYRLRPHSEIPESDCPNYDMDKESLAIVAKETVNCLKWGVMSTRQHKPRCVSATGCVDKKTLDEHGVLQKRSVLDAQEPNKALDIPKQRFEGLKYLCAIAKKGWKTATLDVKKGYWTIRCLSTDVLGVRVWLRQKWVDAALGAAALRSGMAVSSTTLDEVTPEDWAGVDFEECSQELGDWKEFFAVYEVLPMGVRPSGAVFVTVMRQFVSRWRADDWAVSLLHWVDDFLFANPEDDGLLLDLERVTWTFRRLNIPVAFTKSFLGRMEAKLGAFTLIQGQRVAGIYRGHSIVEFLGMVLAFAEGRIYAKPIRVALLKVLVGEVKTKINTSTPYQFILLARICGRLVSMQYGLIPARLMTRSMFAIMKCRTKEDYAKVAVSNPKAEQEVMFWSENLTRFANVGGPMFPDENPFTLEVMTDAGPDGWGSTGRRSSAEAAARTGRTRGVLRCVGTEEVVEVSDEFHENDKAADQVVREMRGLEESLHALVRSKRVSLRDRKVRIKTTSEEVAVWAQYGIRNKFSGGAERVVLYTDCQPARKYMERAGGRSEQCQEIAVRVWTLCMQHCIALEVRWCPGTRMVAVGVDAASRQPWAPGHEWSMRRKYVKVIQRRAVKEGWIQEGDQLRLVGPSSIENGWAEEEWMTAGRLTVARPGRAAVKWTADAMSRGWKTIVVIPLWHGPVMGPIRRASQWKVDLGLANKAFVTRGRNRVLPKWLMCAYACDFR